MRIPLSIISFLLWATCLISAQPATRIAIVAIQEETRGPADLLTAGLTANTNIALVERNELDKAMRESDLARGQGADIVDFGRLLNADGLVLLETVGSSNTLQLASRLVAVNTGVVLDAAVCPLPLPEAAQWVQIAAARLGRLQPKLQIVRKDAIPISLLNLHAAVATLQGAETERALSTLLYHRLAAEPQVFVLERRQLGRAGFEKTLAVEDRAFWTGGYLLEGLIDKDGSIPDSVSITAQLVPPLNRKPISINLSGRSSSLPGIADQLARRILGELNTKDNGMSWEGAAEAERYEQESSWALRWHMWPEAYAAAESAWQLGRHTEETAAARITSLLAQTSPDRCYHGDPYGIYFIFNTNRQYDCFRDVAWTSFPPKPEDVVRSLEAASAFVGVCNQPEIFWNTNASWIRLGTNILATVSEVLAHQYHYGWRNNSFHPDLDLLREAANSLASVLPQEEAKTLRFKMGAFWRGSPRESVEFYRKVIESGGSDPELVFARNVHQPFWVGWSKKDREDGSKAWAGLISDLQLSTNRTSRAYSALFKLHLARLDNDIALAQEQFLNAVLDDTKSRFSTNITFSFLDSFDLVWSNRCSRVETLRRTRLRDSWNTYDFARAKHYLQTASTHNVDRCGWPYAGRFFTQEQAREMIPVVEDYIHRLNGDWMQVVLQWVQRLASLPTDPVGLVISRPRFDPEAYQRVLPEREFTPEEANILGNILRDAGNRHGWPKELRDLNERLRALRFKPVARITTNPKSSNNPQQERGLREADLAVSKRPDLSSVLLVTKQLSPVIKDYRNELAPARFEYWSECDGKIITVGMDPGKGAAWPRLDGGDHVIEIDPATGDSREIVQSQNAGIVSSIRFQFIGDQLFWLHNESELGILNRRSGEIRFCTIDVPVSGSSLITSKDRLFISNRDYIAEFSTSNQTTRLLASKRRKPAANRIDNWAGWSTAPQVWLQDPQTLLANFGGTNIWAWDAKALDWALWPSTIETASAPWSLSFSNTFSRCGDYQVSINGVHRPLIGTGRAELPLWPLPFDYPWNPEQRFGHPFTRCYDGTNLWALMPPGKWETRSNTLTWVDLTDRNLTLLWFHPKWEMPLSIPLKFANWIEKTNFAGEFVVTRFSAGLAFHYKGFSIDPFQHGFWVLPLAALDDWAARNLDPSRNLPRSQPERKRKFDKNGDGVLDHSEEESMNFDEAWTEQEQTRWMRRVLLTFDQNCDDRLDSGELARLASVQYPGIFRMFDLPVRPQISHSRKKTLESVRLLADFDLNKDTFIQGTELRKLSDYLSNPNDMVRFGQPAYTTHRERGPLNSTNVLYRYDVNKNGKIDPLERHLMFSPALRPYDRNTNGVFEPEEIQAYGDDLNKKRVKTGYISN